MAFSYDVQGSNTFLTYSVEADDVVDTMTLGMLTNNRIKGLAPTLFTQMDDAQYVKYNVSGRITAQNCFSGVVNRKRLLGLFHGLIDAMRAAEDYMFDANAVILDMEYVYIDVSTSDAMFICVPINKPAVSEKSLGSFIKEVLFQTQYDQRENCNYVAKLMNYINSNPSPDIESFEMLLNALESEEDKPDLSSRQGSVAQQRKIAVPHEELKKETNTPKKPAQTPLQPEMQYSAAQKKTEKPIAAQPVKLERTMNVPRQTGRDHNSEKAPSGNSDAKKTMSLWYLLNHYSNENVALYRAQKGEAEGRSKKSKNSSDKKEKKNKKTAPTQPVTPSFAIPGQAIPVEEAAMTASSESPQPIKQKREQPAPSVSQAAFSGEPIPAEKHFTTESNQLDFGETSYLTDESNETDETEILGQSNSVAHLMPQLVRSKTKEKILIDKAQFRIGRDADFNDYAVHDNRHVGHTHCHVVIRDGEYFIVDDNSKNHTRVNGEQIPPCTEVKLAHGFHISIADEEFEFRLF